MKTTFTEKALQLIGNVTTAIYDMLPYEGELNYNKCRVFILNNDSQTIWVKWGIYDCELKDLPIIALATIADNILQ